MDCANIVKIFGILNESDMPSIVMEWAPDGSLYEYHMNYDGRYDDLEIVSIANRHRFNELIACLCRQVE